MQLPVNGKLQKTFREKAQIDIALRGNLYSTEHLDPDLLIGPAFCLRKPLYKAIYLPRASVAPGL